MNTCPYILVLLVKLAIFCSCEEIVSLNGAWTVKDAPGDYYKPATVPGGIYTDLMNSGTIGDIFYGYMDDSTKWIPRTNWTYFTNFTDLDYFTYWSTLAHENLNIVFEGVDTFSTVLINDVEVGTTQNMFVKYIFDVKSALKAGNNTIEVRFLSPIEVADKLNDIQLAQYRIPWLCPPDDYHGECHINMIRKMQASFSWDWGPSFPSVGIWKNVYIEAFDHTRIHYVVADVTESDDGTNWIVNVDTYFAINGQNHVQGSVSYKLGALKNGAEVSNTADVDAQVNLHGEIVFTSTLEVPKDSVETWWPNGYGNQTLYDLSVNFTNTQKTESVTGSARIGFRTIELVQDQIISGLTFYFKVNGVPIFMKGANEIPINILPEWGQNQSTVKYLLTSARDANMNMIRVWGGGVYESDYFYEAADELGLLVWQDFMFACSLYPVQDDYLRSVVEEVKHNIKRIVSHPSVAVFSGNNENEGVLANNWYGTSENYTLYKEDYVKLYITTVKTEFDRLTHNRSIFVSSSPTNGKETESEGYVAQNPGDNLYGDVHYYSYAADPFNPTTYPTPRFASEYGYQSLPSVDTLLTQNNDTSAWHPNNEFSIFRQHHPGGNSEMKGLIGCQFKLPDESAENYVEAFVYFSQVYQAQSIKVETEHYRNYRSILDSQGQGYTMGALYWQLNDVWVAPTWSGIDYLGRWKLLHYAAKSFFSPIIVSGEIDYKGQLDVFADSDLLTSTDTVVNVQVYNWSSLTPISNSSFTVSLNASESRIVTTISSANSYLADLNCGSNNDAILNCFFYLTIVDAQTQNPIHENYVFPAALYLSNVPNANLKISSVEQSGTNNEFVVTVTTDNIALFVWLDTHDVRGRFSENGFLLVVGEKSVTFVSDSNLTVAELQKVLTITSVTDFA